jgi:predicted MFS family arabinose efflux permease
LPSPVAAQFADLIPASNVLCGVSATSIAHSFYRGFSGVGAAGILHGSAAIISSGIKPSLSDRCTKFIVTADALALAGGAMLGGVIVDNVTWRWVFFM